MYIVPTRLKSLDGRKLQFAMALKDDKFQITSFKLFNNVYSTVHVIIGLNGNFYNLLNNKHFIFDKL